jgi:hypothetical protein
MEYDQMLQRTFNVLTDPELVRSQLNETLRRENAPEIEKFEFDGPEDINVYLTDGTTREICNETTMDELLQEIGLTD